MSGEAAVENTRAKATDMKCRFMKGRRTHEGATSTHHRTERTVIEREGLRAPALPERLGGATASEDT